MNGSFALLISTAIFGIFDDNPCTLAFPSHREIRVKGKVVVGKEQLKTDGNIVVLLFAH